MTSLGRRVLLICVLLMAAIVPLHAQDETLAFPDGVVGVPYNYSFGIDLAAINAILASSGDSYSFILDFSVAGGNAPPGLKLSVDGLIGTPTAGHGVVARRQRRASP